MNEKNEFDKMHKKIAEPADSNPAPTLLSDKDKAAKTAAAAAKKAATAKKAKEAAKKKKTAKKK